MWKTSATEGQAPHMDGVIDKTNKNIVFPQRFWRNHRSANGVIPDGTDEKEAQEIFFKIFSFFNVDKHFLCNFLGVQRYSDAVPLIIPVFGGVIRVITVPVQVIRKRMFYRYIKIFYEMGKVLLD